MNKSRPLLDESNKLSNRSSKPLNVNDSQKTTLVEPNSATMVSKDSRSVVIEDIEGELKEDLEMAKKNAQTAHKDDDQENLKIDLVDERDIEAQHGDDVSDDDDDDMENINVRAAIVHMMGDMVQSLGVICAALIIYFKPEWKIADPICTFLFSILVMITTIPIFIDCMRILMESSPTDIEVVDVYNAIQDVSTL